MKARTPIFSLPNIGERIVDRPGALIEIGYFSRRAIARNGGRSVPRVTFVQDRRPMLSGSRGLIPALQLPGVMRQTRVPDLDPDLVQPYPNVLEAVARIEESLDVRPGLPDLPCLGSRFLRQSRAEPIQIQFVVRCLIQAPSIP